MRRLTANKVIKVDAARAAVSATPLSCSHTNVHSGWLCTWTVALGAHAAVMKARSLQVRPAPPITKKVTGILVNQPAISVDAHRRGGQTSGSSLIGGCSQVDHVLTRLHLGTRSQTTRSHSLCSY